MLRSILTTVAALTTLVILALPADAQYYPVLPPVPSYPVLITPTQVQGVTPWGGLNTGNQVIHNSVFAPGRTESLYNGSLQQINRPVYNDRGQMVGFQQGIAWQNSLTGQWHHQVETVTPNRFGGSNREVSVGDSQEETPRPRRR